MGDPYNHPYGHHYHHQVKANVTANGASQDFSYNVNSAYGKAPSIGLGIGGIGHNASQDAASSSSHLSSLNDCVNRLQTSLNQYLTKIIDEGSEGPSNYNLGSGEVLNSHLMEQYGQDGGGGGASSGGGGGPGRGGPGLGGVPNTASSFANPEPIPNNGYSYYSNYPQNYPNYHPHHQQSPYGMPPNYSHQYPEFQEPKPKKQKSK